MKKPRFKISPQTFGVMVSRMLLDYDVEPVLALADRSGEPRYVVPGATVMKPVAGGLVAPDGSPVVTGTPSELAAQGNEGRVFERAPLDFMGMPLKIWVEVSR